MKSLAILMTQSIIWMVYDLRYAICTYHVKLLVGNFWENKTIKTMFAYLY